MVLRIRKIHQIKRRQNIGGEQEGFTALEKSQIWGGKDVCIINGNGIHGVIGKGEDQCGRIILAVGDRHEKAHCKCEK